MFKPLTLHQITTAVSGRIINEWVISDTIRFSGVSTDTRSIEMDNIFIPIKGERFDGHHYIDKAYKMGAAICFTESEDWIPKNCCGILVRDSKQALIDFASYYRGLFNIPMIAITGSVGKTTCKEMIASVLASKLKVHKTEGNLNNDIGLPLTIFGLNDDHEVAVIEMGMNHYGELHVLSHIAKPDIAVITNIGISHIENFGSKDGILKAKSEILDYLNKDGIVVLNGDDAYLQKLKGTLNFAVKTFGFHERNTYSVKSYESLGWNGMQATLSGESHDLDITSKELGKHMLLNILPAVVIGYYLQLDDKSIRHGIAQFQNAKMRMHRLKLGLGITVFNDSYNASVDSMKSSLDTVSELKTEGRKVAILGDMFEMGQFAKEAHEEVGKLAAHSAIDNLICVGEYSKWIYDSAKKNGFNEAGIAYYEDRGRLEKQIHNLIHEKDTVIVKASRGMYLEKLVDRMLYIFGNSVR